MFSASKTAGPSGYAIQRSVRLRASATAYFNRTPASATNQRTWTWSNWVKRGALGTEQQIFEGGVFSGSTEQLRIFFTSTDNIEFNEFSSAAYQFRYVTTQVFRDPSAWYHIVAVLDTTDATSTNRVKLYINGVQVTSFSTSTTPTLNFQGKVNSVIAHDIGRRNGTGTPYLDGYLTEINFIDGQALTPTSFGAYNSTTGVWQPKAYSGTYGTNGFFLKFADNSAATAAAIGKDSSGNGNNWTPNNISVTAGITYDSMTDVPTLTSASAANFPTLSPLQITAANIGVLSNANISWSCAGFATYGKIYGTMSFPSSGQYYWEVTAGATANLEIGIISASDQTTFYPGYSSVGYVYYQNTGNKVNNNVSSAYGASYTTNDVIGVAFDATAGTLTFYKNNVSQGTAFTGLTGTYVPTLGNESSSASTSASINFGQRPFTYTPPTGYNRLNTYNLATPTIPNGAAQFAATLYTGTGATLTVANTVNSVNFQPDFVWIKGRSGATSHDLYDSVRGTTKQLIITTAAETTEATGLTAFGSTGFTVGALASLNTNAATYIAWQWKASNATAVTNTAGSITSSVSANPTAGFSVVTYTGTGANATVGHGLGIAPNFIIIKSRSAIANWMVGGSNIASAGGGTWASVMEGLNTTSAVNTGGTAVFNSTAPTSSVFSLGTEPNTNGSGRTFVAYCWAAIQGFSAFGKYTGNGSADGPFVYTGFRPRFVCVKRSDATGGWTILDSSRDTYNVASQYLFSETSAAEGSVALEDFLSNGFKLRSTSSSVNSAGTYIYFAFAENPFNYSLAR